MPWVPAKLLMRTRLDSQAKLASYHGPLLQFHGTKDSVVPFTLGQQLHAAANEPKWFVPILGGDHNDPRTPRYFEELDAFLNGLPTTGQNVSEGRQATNSE